MMKSRLIILLILSLSILDLSCNSSRDRGNPSGYMDVTKVVDGDTFWADDGSEKGIKIRLISKTRLCNGYDNSPEC